MSTTGEIIATGADNSAEAPFDDITWTDVTDALDCAGGDSAYLQFSVGEYSYTIITWSYDFSAIPDDATIDGVICRAACYASHESIYCTFAQLTDTSGVYVGDNMLDGAPGHDPVEVDSGGFVDIVVGSDSDTWGNALTPSWVKNADFGVGIGFQNENYSEPAIDLLVNCISLEIYYTEASGGSGVIVSSRAYESRSPRPVQRRPSSRG